VEARRALAGGEQAEHVGGVGVGVDHQPAHAVVGGGCHLHRGARDVEELVLDELAVHAGQSLEDEALAPVADVEEHAAVGSAPPLDDLAVVGQRHAVAGAQLHAGRVVTGHEPLAGGVVQTTALAANCFGHEGPRRLLGSDHAGGVELDELHVLDAAPGLQAEEDAVAEVLVATGRAAPPEAGVASAAQHDRVRQEGGATAVVQVEGDGSETGAVRHQQTADAVVLDHRDAQLPSLGRQRGDDGAARPVAGEAGATPPVGAEEALGQAAVLGPSEWATPLDELGHRRGSLPDHGLDHPRVTEAVALLHRVGEVLLPAVLGVDGTERRVDAPGRQNGVGVEPTALAEHEDLGPCLGGGDGSPQTGPARADDQHVDGVSAHSLPPRLPVRSDRSQYGTGG
jgi:hypothetical protein